MAAEIIQLPRKNHKSVRSVDLYFCWDKRLNNPLLNNLFKEEICYVERWYLQTTHLLNVEEINHPLIRLLLDNNDKTLDLLLDATEKDLCIQHTFNAYSTLFSTEYNIGKLIKWKNKWLSLINHRQLL